MPIEADFLEFMTQVVTVAQPGVRNLQGEATYGPATSYSARVVYKNQMVRALTGDEVVSRSHAYVYGLTEATPDSLVTLPDGTTPVILAVEEYPDEDGPHHHVIYFGGAGRV